MKSRLSIPLILPLLLPVTTVAAEPAAPRLSLASDGHAVTVRWDAVDQAEGYRLYYTPYPYQDSEGVHSLDLGSATELSADLWEDAAYYVAVAAYDTEASSDYSNIEHFTLGTDRIAFTSDAGSYHGLTLFTPITSTETYLIDDTGEVRHQWSSGYRPGLSVYLLEDGHLLRTGYHDSGYFNEGGKGGVIEELDWDGNAVWSFQYSDQTKSLHHDIERLPDGNVLALSWEQHDDERWSEVIVEIEPQGSDGGSVVWSWDVWDHLDELGLDPDAASGEDWIHLNSIDYNRATDQILVSSRNFNQLWVIDKADGNVATQSSVDLFGQHDAKWIDDSDPDSNVTVFDNGSSYSRSLELSPGLDTILWSYGNDSTEYFYGDHISGTQRLENGNTLVCNGVEGVVFELDGDGNKLREYTNPYGSTTPRGTITQLFRAEKYASGYTPYF